ncbi:hypothetical protein R1sor_005909 [Riccia sorocarpa]|uniref:Uncharacterized protein n=1 Tax=Riccia sorocarpa TaxID=122646 RepID=A0ABD3HLF4_9MARC
MKPQQSNAVEREGLWKGYVEVNERGGEREACHVGTGLIMGHMKPIRSLVSTMATEIAGVATFLAGVGRDFMVDQYSTTWCSTGERQTNCILCKTRTHLSILYLLPYAALQGLNHELLESEFRLSVVKSISDHICGSPADSEFYSNCGRKIDALWEVIAARLPASRVALHIITLDTSSSGEASVGDPALRADAPSTCHHRPLRIGSAPQSPSPARVTGSRYTAQMPSNCLVDHINSISALPAKHMGFKETTPPYDYSRTHSLRTAAEASEGDDWFVSLRSPPDFDLQARRSRLTTRDHASEDSHEKQLLPSPEEIDTKPHMNVVFIGHANQSTGNYDF